MTVKMLQPKDVIAILVLVSFVFLTFNGIDSPLTEVVTLMLGYYFGHRNSGVDDGK